MRIPLEVPTRAPTGRTNAYLLGEQDPLLVDPAAQSPELDEALADRPPSHVAVTHHHGDHVGAVAHYVEKYDPTVWARRGRESAFVAATGVDPDRTFREGTRLPAADGVVVRETPGHALEHVAFETDQGLVSGDLALASGSVVVGAPEGDMRAYLTSLRRVHASEPETMLPGHGPRIDDPRATCERLIGHRLDRERRVLTAVSAGAATVEDIVDAAYDKDLSGVADLATATVVAHLEKLAHEGRLDWDGERASPR